MYGTMNLKFTVLSEKVYGVTEEAHKNANYDIQGQAEIPAAHHLQRSRKPEA